MSAFLARSILALIAAAGLVPQSSSFETESRREGETCNTNSDCAGALRCETGTCRGVAGAPQSITNALDALGRCRVAQGDPGNAVELWAAAQLLHQQLGLPVERRDQPALARDLDAAKTSLGPDRFAQHWDTATQSPRVWFRPVSQDLR